MAERVGALYYDVTLDTAAAVRNSRQMQAENQRTAGSFDALTPKLNLVTRAIALLGAAMALIKAAQLADEFRLLGARVQVAAGSIEAGAAAMDSLRKISERTQTAIADNAQVFQRLNPSIVQMGGNSKDTLQVVELLAKAIKVSGASAQEQSSAMIQFGQALGSGKLAGDELRSLLENAPYLMKQLAAGLGVPIGQLKSLGEQGKLTSDVVVAAMRKAAESIDRDFAKVPQTLTGAWTVTRDAAGRLNEAVDTLSGKSAALTGITKGIGDALDSLARFFGLYAKEADGLARNKQIEAWARETVTALSYVADAADVTQQALSVFGRNVYFTFATIGDEIGGFAAQIGIWKDAVANVLKGDGVGALTSAWRQAEAVGEDIAKRAEARRAELDAKDANSLRDRLLAGQRIRQQVAALAAGTDGSDRLDRAARGDSGAPSKLRAPVDPEEQRKLAAKRAAAQAYLDGLIADQKAGLAKIDAEEVKALEVNKRHMLEDQANRDIYERAKLEIIQKYARERALLEDKTQQDIAAVAIATTIEETERIEKIRAEAVRHADAQVRLGVITFEQGERAKVLAAFVSEKALEEVTERRTKARADTQVAITLDAAAAITLAQDESIRQAEAAYRRGALTFEEAEAQKVRAVLNAVEQRKRLEEQRQGTRIETLQLQAGTGGVDAQLALIEAEMQKRLKANEEARQRDLGNAKLYADLEVEIVADAERRKVAARFAADQVALQSAAATFASLGQMAQAFGGEQDRTSRALFAVSKAFAIADALVKIQQGVASALSLPYPANIAAAAVVAAQGANIVGIIKGTNYGGGRQYGGPVSQGSLYRVNESGKPEMFTSASGAQYMMPTEGGRVSPTTGGGATGASVIELRVINQAPNMVGVTQRRGADGRPELVISEVAAQISEHRGEVWRALAGSTNVRSAL
jgi:tape measure domain-containing protein